MEERNQFLLSIIVPVYNAEKLINRCIDSILSQKYTDFELLLIDDGSSDNSLQICNEYALRDNRIKVFHKDNGGVSSARNIGLNECTGDYIAFVDCDDYVSEDLYTRLLAYAPFDIALFGITQVNESGNIINQVSPSETVQTIFFNKDFSFINNLIFSSLFGYATNKIFSRSVINGIQYKKLCSREDFVFFKDIIKPLNSIILIPESGYYYVQHTSSALHSGYCGEVPDICGLISELNQIHPHLSNKQNKVLCDFVIKEAVIDNIRKYIFLNNSLNGKAKKTELKRILNSKELRKSIIVNKKDNFLKMLLTMCSKARQSTVFYLIMKRIWLN